MGAGEGERRVRETRRLSPDPLPTPHTHRSGSPPSRPAGRTRSPSLRGWTLVRVLCVFGEGVRGRTTRDAHAHTPLSFPPTVPPPRKLPGDPELPDEDEEFEKQEKPAKPGPEEDPDAPPPDSEPGEAPEEDDPSQQPIPEG